MGLRKSLEIKMTPEEELAELKAIIDQCWYNAYPESPLDERDNAKQRIFNLYQDLKDTRFNYRVLSKAYNEMDAKLNDYNRNNQN
jgi:hypothetical protein